MLLKSTQKFLRELHRIGAIKVDTEKGFRLALHDKNPSAPLSPLYINLRTPHNKDGPLETPHVEFIATELMSLTARHRISYDAIAGIPRAGTPFALKMASLSRATGLKKYVRVVKIPDTERSMLWAVPRNESDPRRVLIVDDLITRADTKLAAIRALETAGYEVAGIAMYLDREQGGIRELQKMLIPAYAAITMTEMLGFYGTERLIDAEDLRIIKAYLQH